MNPRQAVEATRYLFAGDEPLPRYVLEDSRSFIVPGWLDDQRVWVDKATGEATTSIPFSDPKEERRVAHMRYVDLDGQPCTFG